MRCCWQMLRNNWMMLVAATCIIVRNAPLA